MKRQSKAIPKVFNVHYSISSIHKELTMKTKMLCFAVMAGVLLFPFMAIAQVPHQVGGFLLGNDINDYKARVNMATALCSRYMEYIQEVEINNIPGFKSGVIGYGICAAPNRILRIKLKYADASEAFYDQLMDRFINRFGKPHEWRGDPFHVVKIWKWSFVDGDGDHFSLFLQHNSKDSEQKMGNAVKLTLTSQIERERLCYEKKNPDLYKSRHMMRSPMGKNEPVDWEMMIPQ
jgi:hypothetical protein